MVVVGMDKLSDLAEYVSSHAPTDGWNLRIVRDLPVQFHILYDMIMLMPKEPKSSGMVRCLKVL